MERLAAAGCVAAIEEAEDLLAAAPDRATLLAFLSRREVGEPLAWITGSAELAGVAVVIEPGVYVPRAQTAELARRAASLLADDGSAADICTGCGAIAAFLQSAHPSARVVATDIDRRAVACARRNRVATALADLDRGLRSDRFDVVTAVTPYVPTGKLAFLPADTLRYEPRLALDGGSDGLDVLRRLISGAARILHPGGWLLTEIGGDQAADLGSVLAAAAFAKVVTWEDEDGVVRGLAAERL